MPELEKIPNTREGRTWGPLFELAGVHCSAGHALLSSSGAHPEPWCCDWAGSWCVSKVSAGYMVGGGAKEGHVSFPLNSYSVRQEKTNNKQLSFLIVLF